MNISFKAPVLSSAVALLVLSILTVLAHSGSLKNGFYFDDSHVLVNNEAIRSLSNTSRFFYDASTFTSDPHNQQHRPIVTLSYALNYAVSGLEPFGYHLANLVIHVLVGFLVYLVVKELFSIWTSIDAPLALVVSLIAAGWFVITPQNTETINYMSARSSSLATLFYLLAFIFFLRAQPERKMSYVPVFLCATLSLMCKEIALSLPLLLLFFVWWDQGQKESIVHGTVTLNSAKSARAHGPEARSTANDGYFRQFGAPVALLVFMCVFYASRAVMLPIDRPSTVTSLDLLTKIGTQSRAHLHYMRQFFFPTEFPIDAVGFGFTDMNDPRSMISIFMLLGFGAFILLGRKKLPLLTFGLLWYFIAISPSSSFANTTQPINYHRPYIALPGLCCAMAAIFLPAWTYLSAGRRTMVSSLVLGSLTLAIGSWYVNSARQENSIWSNGKELWEVSARLSPQSGRAQMNLGLVYMAEGNYAEAERYFKKCLEVWPGYAFAYTNLGVLYRARGQFEEAGTYFRRAHELWPYHPVMARYLADYLISQGEYGEAIEVLDRVITDKPEPTRLRDLRAKAESALTQERQNTVGNSQTPLRSPNSRPATSEVGLRLLKNGHNEEALAFYADWLEKNPEDPSAHAIYNNMGTAQMHLGRYDDASESFRKALLLEPGTQLYENNIRWALQEEAAQNRETTTID